MTVSNDNRFYVYVHRRQSDNTIFYVGKGTGYRCKRTDRNAYWQNIVDRHGYHWEIVLNNLTEQQAISLEIDLIKFYGRENLCNLTDGGEGMAGHVRPQSVRDAIGKAHKGMKRSADTCRNISEALRGRPVSKEMKQRISTKLKGMKLSAETKAKMSKARKGVLHSDEWKQNISKAWKTSPERYAERCKAMSDLRITKNVLCVETGNVFKSSRHAVKWLLEIGTTFKPKTSGIARCCLGDRNQAYGYRWQYVN